jgi:glutaminyl-tRNA synthetase
MSTPTAPQGEPSTPSPGLDFIREIIVNDRAAGKHGGRVHTRFPPEPNGYLHIGHAKSICLNFGIAGDFDGLCNLRFDDTNPTTEDVEYVDSIQEDVRWLGFDWGDRLFFAADYFERMYDCAEQLIRIGKAYVDSLTADEIREHRGTLTEAGRNSPYRDRPVEENLDLFRRMRAGEFPDGTHVLRAKIDMASPNINMRDPALYRIRHATHHRTGDAWCIYPMYDYAHPLEDAFEGITHSLCTLEFEDHRPFYDWVINTLDLEHTPQQIEFARLNLSYTVMSKRKLLRLVQDGLVTGWDDPRMPTLAGLRRRGITPEAIRDFCDRIGLAKKENTIDVALLEHCVREDLNKRAARVMAVLRPLKLVIENFPDGEVEWMDAVNNPENADAGSRRVPFTRELFIEQDDFREDPPKKYHRLSPGAEVRLRYGYIVKCTGLRKDPATGAITEVRCTYDPATLSGKGPEAGRRVKGTIHWVSAAHALPVEVRLYDRLFTKEDPEDVPEGQDFRASINPGSLEAIERAWIEPAAAGSPPGYRCQFERLGYFVVDPETTPDRLVFNRIVPLRDTWAKIERQGQ